MLLSTSHHQTICLSHPTLALLQFAHPHTFFSTHTNQQHALLHPLRIVRRRRYRLACASSRGMSDRQLKPVIRSITNARQTGLGDVLSGTAQGTNTLLSGGANNAISSAGNSVADVSNSAGDLVTRQLEEVSRITSLDVDEYHVNQMTVTSNTRSHSSVAKAMVPRAPTRLLISFLVFWLNAHLRRKSE